jgi:hypothetical protein
MTKSKIEGLKAPDPNGVQTLYWAEGTDYPGLGILVSGKTATKTWVVQARPKAGGPARRATIGHVAEFSAEEAWEKARKEKDAIRDGVDLRAEARRERERAVTVQAALDAYLADSSNLRPRSIAQYRGLFRSYLGPWLDRQLRSIEVEDVRDRADAIRREVKKRRETAPPTAST